MGIMRKTLLMRLRKELSIPVQQTYGYITKMLREKNNLPKSHTNDAKNQPVGIAIRIPTSPTGPARANQSKPLAILPFVRSRYI